MTGWLKDSGLAKVRAWPLRLYTKAVVVRLREIGGLKLHVRESAVLVVCGLWFGLRLLGW